MPLHSMTLCGMLNDLRDSEKFGSLFSRHGIELGTAMKEGAAATFVLTAVIRLRAAPYGAANRAEQQQQAEGFLWCWIRQSINQ